MQGLVKCLKVGFLQDGLQRRFLFQSHAFAIFIFGFDIEQLLPVSRCFACNPAVTRLKVHDVSLQHKAVIQAPAQTNLLLASRIANNDYESAIAQLERVLDVGRDRLDSATVRKVEEKLALIDKAIDEARQALSADPSNAYLNRYLAGTMRRKLDLLRRTAALTEL